MKVTINGTEITCDSALRGDDYVLLFTEGQPTITFQNVVDFEAFVLSGGEWSYPYVTLDADLWDSPKATGTVTITGTASTEIPLGTIIKQVVSTGDDSGTTQETGVQFETTATATIAEGGTVDVAVRCTAGGTQGNLAENSTFTAEISGVTAITNAAAFTGGDSEPFTQNQDYPGVTPSNVVWVSPRAEGRTPTEDEALANGMIEATYQGDGYLTFTAKGYKPDIDLKFNVYVKV